MSVGAVQKPKGWTLNLFKARIPGTDWSDSNLTNADLRFADFTGSSFRGSNLYRTRLEGTILRGADLSGVRNLTWEQLDQAVIDETTVLPDYLSRDRRPVRSAKAESEG